VKFFAHVAVLPHTDLNTNLIRAHRYIDSDRYIDSINNGNSNIENDENDIDIKSNRDSNRDINSNIDIDIDIDSNIDRDSNRDINSNIDIDKDLDSNINSNRDIDKDIDRSIDASLPLVFIFHAAGISIYLSI
jgi:hypothetical protein